MSILEIKELNVSFKTFRGAVDVLKGINLNIDENEVVGIIGESGSGKSVTALSIMGLIDKNSGEIKSGEIIFDNKDLLKLNEKELCNIRGNNISMIFQEPMTSLNPVMTIYKQLREVYKIHTPKLKNNCKPAIIDILNKLNISDAEKVLNKYPFELSGGIKQRIMIAMAIICNPRLIICDEPTTALDVTTQAEILKLFKNIKTENNTSIMFITHDLGVIAEIAERVVVMYFGNVVEECSAEEFFNNPKHPYSRDLLLAKPENFNGRFKTIEGIVPSMYEKLEGCSYYSRCSLREDFCKTESPDMVELGNGHSVRCFKHNYIGE